MSTSLEHTTIIIGAGMAGLTAAYYLQSLREDARVLILEARDRVGGRIDTLTNWDNTPIELGANLLIDAGTRDKPNPLVPLLKKYSLNTTLIDALQSETFDSNGNAQTLEKRLSLASDYYHAAFFAIQKAKLGKEPFPSLGEILHFNLTHPRKPSTPEFIARQTLIAMIEHHTGTTAKNTSLFALMESEEYSGPNQFVTGGYYHLPQQLAASCLATGKVEIKHNTNIIKVERIKNAGVRITDSKNQKFLANSVLCTVPLGVLKHHKIHFVPALSAEKQQAIKHLEVGHHNVVALKFARPFWKQDAHVLFPGSTNVHEWPEYLNLFHFSNQRTATLICHFYADAANFKDLSDAAIIEKALQPLKKVYGNKVTPLVHAQVTRWDIDPYALGSTSCYGTHFTRKDFQHLASPEPQGLFFAGAHSITNGNRETVHGAYLSGQRAALEVSRYLHKQFTLTPEPAFTPPHSRRKKR